MKIFIQELIRGHIEVIKNKEYVPDIAIELINRKIPFKIDYINDDDIALDTMTQSKNRVVSTANTRESKII